MFSRTNCQRTHVKRGGKLAFFGMGGRGFAKPKVLHAQSPSELHARGYTSRVTFYSHELSTRDFFLWLS